MKNHTETQALDPQYVKYRYQKLGYTQADLSKIFRRHKTRICHAVTGRNPKLLVKINDFLDKMEARKNAKAEA